MSKYNYFPIIKTTDAELKGFSNLNDIIKNNILPIFELTKSRLSKKNNPNGDIWKRLEQIKEYMGNNPFILDLTTEEILSNQQIDRMLNKYENGFQEWVNFIKELNEKDFNVIPAIHYNPHVQKDVIKEIQSLSSISSNLAFRVDVADEDIPEYLDVINSTTDASKLILILDGGYKPLQMDLDNGDKSALFVQVLDKIKKFNVKAVICAFSSFPDSVLKKGYGASKNYGSFAIAENITFNALKKHGVFHGDYASVHPQRYETGGGTWVPRIDFMDELKFFYYRYERENGGYVKAAEKVVSDKNYQTIKEFNSWGDEEILLASQGIPSGRNPSHWIAVRVNLFISKQWLRLKKENQMSL